MNSKTGITFSIVAIVVVIALFASGPLVATHQAQAFFHRQHKPSRKVKIEKLKERNPSNFFFNIVAPYYWHLLTFITPLVIMEVERCIRCATVSVSCNPLELTKDILFYGES